jgi:ribosomal protein L40E
VWKYTTGDYVSSSPAVANGVVYVGSDDCNVYALNAAMGTLVWKYTTGSGASSCPAVANGVVYVGSGDGKVYALNAATGTLVWNYTTGSYVGSSPTVANGVVYVGSDDCNVYALNAAMGTLVWKHTTGSGVDSSPAVANGVVYVGSNDFKVYALNAATGTLVWNYTTGNYVRSSPAVANGVVYVGSDDCNVYALNAATGTLVWKYTTGSAVYSPPAVASSVVYVGGWDGYVYAFGSLPLSVSISPYGTGVVIDLGGSETFASTVSGGTAPYTYQWYLNGAAVSYATSSSWAFTPSSTGSYVVYLVVTDSETPTPNMQQSNNAVVTVNSAFVPPQAGGGVPIWIIIVAVVAVAAVAATGIFKLMKRPKKPPVTAPSPTPTKVKSVLTRGLTWLHGGKRIVLIIFLCLTALILAFSVLVEFVVSPLALVDLIEMALIGEAVVAVACAGAFVKLRRRPEKPLKTPPPPTPTKLKVQAEPTEILADGKSKSTITLQLQDQRDVLTPASADTEVKITTTRGTLETPVVKILVGKDSEKTVLTSSTETGPVTVSARARGLKTASATLSFVEKKRFCMHCGVLIPFKATRCPKCGKTPPAGVDTKTCKNCNSVIPVVAKFCSECGAGQPEQEN